MINLMPSRFASAMLMVVVICHVTFGKPTSNDTPDLDSVEQAVLENDHAREAEGAGDADQASQTAVNPQIPAITDPGSVSELIHSPMVDDDLDELEPLRGDFDLDGVLDVDKDLELLSEQICKPEPDLSYDLNRDGKVTVKDTVYFIEKILGAFVGDTNLDHRFETSDLTAAWQAAKFNTGQPASWSEGDWNGDGIFDESDMSLVELSRAYEQPIVRRSATTDNVREPIVLSLVGMGLVFLLLTYTVLQGQKKVLNQPPPEAS